MGDSARGCDVEPPRAARRGCAGDSLPKPFIEVRARTNKFELCQTVQIRKNYSDYKGKPTGVGIGEAQSSPKEALTADVCWSSPVPADPPYSPLKSKGSSIDTPKKECVPH